MVKAGFMVDLGFIEYCIGLKNIDYSHVLGKNNKGS